MQIFQKAPPNICLPVVKIYIRSVPQVRARSLGANLGELQQALKEIAKRKPRLESGACISKKLKPTVSD